MKKNKLQHIKLKENPFKVPIGYFDTVEDDVFANLSSERFPEKDGFSSPEGYFDDVENGVFEELSKEKPIKESGYAIPEGYLETVEENVLEKLSGESKSIKVISLKDILLKRVLPVAVAASLLLIIYINFNNKTSSFESITATDIEQWIENDLITLDTYEIAEVYSDTEIENQDIYAEDELEEYLNGMDVESLLYEN